jgi:predicted PurR-regulated permease PerM
LKRRHAGEKRLAARDIIIIIMMIIMIIIIIINTAQVIPLVISPTGVIPKSLPQSLKRLNLHLKTYIQMQKSVILGTCSIVRNSLNYK